MERLPGLLAHEPVYWIERVAALSGGRLRTELGFSDVAAHPYEALVEGTVAMLRGVPGVERVIHEDREVVLVDSRGVAVEQLGDVVDRYWFEHLPSTPIDPGYETDPSDVLASPWPSVPPPPRGPVPATEPAEPTLRDLREAMALPPSRRRMWTYLVCGAVPLVGGAVLAATPGGGNGVIPIVLGAVNIAVGVRIAVCRASLAGAREH
ncbi:hypothetical protein Cfla_0805 [Cellulomonas flavigena DSM 20109]|uniref:Uncharacterized protein n=1 Tax=Cellulomonas flavigena (strain ATCC 482 / DSM 20109 / BCRC 11376 / JCM 18109 / NBRC 3775 / NCIMB 8073 / NRS 134) TaxID=446466 RepID=D5UJX3_CELFN|nr:hypothetical protein [Cellulomonas flavigena]ADG73715.1 hypothetical protein Cfla_0805 [Cellulomonas flavigena DSM 20109]